MSNTKYSYQGEKEGTASVFARGVRISFKESYEIANELRGKTVAKAQKFLSDVLELKAAVPYRRYNHGVPHRTGIGPGRFPKNASERFLKAVNEVEANAEAKGLNTSNLRLIHVSAHKARPLRGNFKGSPQMHPMVHIELVAKEEAVEVKSDKKEGKTPEKEPKTEKKEVSKTEEKKPEEKKEQKPKTPTKEDKS